MVRGATGGDMVRGATGGDMVRGATGGDMGVEVKLSTHSPAVIVARVFNSRHMAGDYELPGVVNSEAWVNQNGCVSCDVNKAPTSSTQGNVTWASLDTGWGSPAQVLKLSVSFPSLETTQHNDGTNNRVMVEEYTKITKTPR
ncbi:hypothetical protein Hamer_G009575 [Homarus americanus]|uniref:Uncharacterized protein n=1 Tax=Homarus americanus TaxID=6706 RepID=A0A8J5N2P3_HOMAM|nr:hypothetical protein Hamer_G009575 [Homarus americanus]